MVLKCGWLQTWFFRRLCEIHLYQFFVVATSGFSIAFLGFDLPKTQAANLPQGGFFYHGGDTT